MLKFLSHQTINMKRLYNNYILAHLLFKTDWSFPKELNSHRYFPFLFRIFSGLIHDGLILVIIMILVAGLKWWFFYLNLIFSLLEIFLLFYLIYLLLFKWRMLFLVSIFFLNVYQEVYCELNLYKPTFHSATNIND